jgi:hypothetical protein
MNRPVDASVVRQLAVFQHFPFAPGVDNRPKEIRRSEPTYYDRASVQVIVASIVGNIMLWLLSDG